MVEEALRLKSFMREKRPPQILGLGPKQVQHVFLINRVSPRPLMDKKGKPLSHMHIMGFILPGVLLENRM